MSDRKECGACYGRGHTSEREYVSSIGCGGMRRVFGFDRARTCGSCSGSGGRERSVERPCYSCRGSGYQPD